MNLSDLKRERRGDPDRVAGVFYAMLSCAALGTIPLALGTARGNFEMALASACAAIGVGLAIAAVRSFQGRAVSIARGLPALFIVGTMATLLVVWYVDAWRQGRPLVVWEGTWRIVPVFVVLVLVKKLFTPRRDRNGGRAR